MYHSFGERSNFPRIWFRNLKFGTWGLEINYLNAHNFVWQGYFFFHYYLASSMTDWAPICTGLLFYAYVAIHQVRRPGLWQLPIVSSVFNTVKEESVQINEGTITLQLNTQSTGHPHPNTAGNLHYSSWIHFGWLPFWSFYWLLFLCEKNDQYQ